MVPWLMLYLKEGVRLIQTNDTKTVNLKVLVPVPLRRLELLYTKGVVSKLFEASARRQCEASEQAIKGLLIKSFFLAILV